MYLTEHFGLSLSALVVWGLMMAFFFNLFLWIADLKRNNVLLLSSFIVFLSYFISDHLFTWFANSNVYLNWAIYDIITITLITISAHFVKNNCKPPAFFYVIFVLSVNTILSSLMYYDLRIAGNTTPWVLWDIYSFGVYFLDFTMIVALIVDRDILGLIRLKNGIKALFKGQQIRHSL
ncbi:MULTISPECIES: hypothetical protein [Pseudoalteromonas]|uniref:hypothetical protein n=1 Tax=Pseudoalteromonas TaxID=53246 RepID=UPI0003630DAD|nr:MULTISPECIES: hypothetical protein [Pseudoalteromonas]TMN74469.1 hypothetical protein CWB85_00975 [Pseudoalteromonas sp. S1727]